MDETQAANSQGRDAFVQWQKTLQQNIYLQDEDFIHTMRYIFPKDFARIQAELIAFGEDIPNKLEPLVAENHELTNLPKLEPYNGIGERTDRIEHHPSYTKAGDIIYGTKLLEKMAKPGGLAECLSLFFLSSHAGEAGHNCPIACSAGIIRVFHRTSDFPNKSFYLKKLIAASYQTNFTGAQFLTEIQGGSDVGLNATYAKQDEKNNWRIAGEKWFCSNANAELIFITARYDEKIPGTKGLALFLVPALWKEEKNHYTMHRLKEKIGTRTLATAEIDFHGAHAYLMGDLENSFHLVMNNVLHLSRIFNTITVLGIARRAYQIALSYAQHRIAFSHPICEYPLVKENLARIKAENSAMLAGIFDTIKMQDQFDLDNKVEKNSALLLRLLVNIQKYLSALLSVEHTHHALDVLAGNGTIETFSPLPRLLTDSIVCENWEGTHNTLRMQVLKDILKYNVDEIYFSYLKSELKKCQDSDYSKIIFDELQSLEQETQKFRQGSSELQALKIRFIVDRMAVLYCALRLLFEALDQLQSDKTSSKLDCFHYFCLLHFNQSEIQYNENYLKLISRITHA